MGFSAGRLGPAGVGLAVALALAASAAAAAECKIVQRGELKVEPGTRRPKVAGEVNGQPLRILVDTGAWSSTITAAAADRLHLPMEGSRAWASGAGDVQQLRMTRVPAMTISGIKATRMLLPVITTSDDEVDMLLGDEFFNDYDVEFDLQHGAIRLLTLTGCSDDEVPYWSKGAYTLAPIVSAESDVTQPYKVQLKLNGHPVEAEIDSGASWSYMTPAAVRLAAAQVEASAGRLPTLGGDSLLVSVARLDSFQIGDEVIHGVRLRVADLNRGVGFQETGSRIARREAPITMLLGADFLRSHRVVMSKARRKVYLTYAGGPVFAVEAAAPPAIARRARSGSRRRRLTARSLRRDTFGRPRVDRGTQRTKNRSSLQGAACGDMEAR